MAAKKKTPPAPRVQLHPAMDGLLSGKQIAVGRGFVSRRSLGLSRRWVVERIAASNGAKSPR